jgi:DMSO/TMAO reductase YedYZ molybdopterin-dependent catalytic subunit
MTSEFLQEHFEETRRHFLTRGVLSTAVFVHAWKTAMPQESTSQIDSKPRQRPDKAGAQAEPYFTSPGDFRDVSRGKPLPHKLPEEKMRQVGMTRDTWKLEVISDADYPATIDKPMMATSGTALDFEGLMKLAETHAVRFPKVMTCLNLGCPLGMGLWEGVPLREVIWRTEPKANLRRVYYYGYHNDDPKQMFRSSLPIGRVLEDPFETPPVILCYKLNGNWLDAERGGPVRMVVPEAYGFKSIKWLTHVVLTNLPHANDTYADQNNDVDSPLKTFAASLIVPKVSRSNTPLAFSGYAQVGVSGLRKVQVSIEPVASMTKDETGSYHAAPWVDAELLGPPAIWNALEGGVVPKDTFGFGEAGKPHQWPMRFCNAHWVYYNSGLPAGDYVFRCRSIDANCVAQPMPRPFRKSGFAAIESIEFKVT